MSILVSQSMKFPAVNFTTSIIKKNANNIFVN